MDPLTRLPRIIQAGDTLSVSLSYTDYPASTYDLAIIFINSTEFYSIDATPSGDTFIIDVEPSSTGLLSAGDYNYYIKIYDSYDVYTVESGTLTIKAAYTSAVDTRTHNKKMYDALTSLIEGKATYDVASYSIAGRSITKLNFGELIKYQQQYKGLVDEEVRAEKIARGEFASNDVFIQFRNI